MRRVIIFLIICFLLALVFIYSVIRLRPVVFTEAEARMKNIALGVISKAVAESIQEKNIDYHSLIEIGRDLDGNVTSLSSRVENVNIFKALVFEKILKGIEISAKKEYKIPLGNLTGSLLFTGRGPDIKVKIIETSFLQGQIKSELTESGINQTKHSVKIDLTIKMKIMMLTGAYDLEVSDSVIIADTVIVGRVPEGYTSINKADDELIGDVVDFQAE